MMTTKYKMLESVSKRVVWLRGNAAQRRTFILWTGPEVWSTNPLGSHTVLHISLLDSALLLFSLKFLSLLRKESVSEYGTAYLGQSSKAPLWEHRHCHYLGQIVPLVWTVQNSLGNGASDSAWTSGRAATHTILKWEFCVSGQMKPNWQPI